MNQISAVRGMKDILPESIGSWQSLERHLSDILSAYAYEEIRFPIVEKTALFSRSIGEVTDIVEKEMYTFDDRNGDSLTLRPEGTAGCVRAGIENGILYNQTKRLWYMGPMFRHERPQKGRYRQFYQLGVEAFGFEGPEIDLELLLICKRFWEVLGVSEHITLELNSIGSSACRVRYKEVLVSYLESNQDALDEDSKRRLHTNPLRILDSKNPKMADVLNEAPNLLDSLSDEAKTYFDKLCQLLDKLDLSYTLNPRLVRGLDYYSDTVFEWTTDLLGAQSTVCAGGRYDTLVEQLGGHATKAVGFAMGLERLVEIINLKTEVKKEHSDIFVIAQGTKPMLTSITIAEKIRSALPHLNICHNGEDISFKRQFKRADKSGAPIGLVFAEDECQRQVVGIKHLTTRREQGEVSFDKLVAYLEDYFGVERG